MSIKLKNKNIRKSKYSNLQLNAMDVLDVYKLVLRGDVVRFPPGFWQRPESEQNSIECMKFLIEEILKWNDDDIKEKLKMTVFIKNKLAGMMQILYANSPYMAISKLYPDRFHPWELNEAPSSFWKSKENRIKAMKWLIEEKLNWSDEDIINSFNGKILIDNGLGGLLTEMRGSALDALEEYIPNKFNKWQFNSSNSGANYWAKKENRVKAVRHLIEDKLKWSDEDIKAKLSQMTFRENNLNALLNSYYNGSVYLTLNEAYPDKFLPWELSCVMTGFWDVKENRVKAIKWMIEEKLKWSIDDIKNKLSRDTFIKCGLAGLLTSYKGGMAVAIEEAYPGMVKPWECGRTVANSFWQSKKNRFDALNWLYKDVLKWSDDEIKTKTSQKIFKNNNLTGLLNYYSGSPYNVLMEYFPNEDIKPWLLLNGAPNGYWKDEANCEKALNWFIDKYEITLDNAESVTKSMITQAKLAGFLIYKYKNRISDFKKSLIDKLNN